MKNKVNRSISSGVIALMMVLCMSTAQSHAQVGSWTAPIGSGGIEAIHMTMLHTGRIFVYSFRQGAAPYPYRAFDPANPTLGTTGNTPSNFFCSGHTVLADGSVLMVDGEAGGDLGRFDPVQETFPIVGNTLTSNLRWYPSTIIMGNGKAITFGGVGIGGVTPNVLSAEVYDPSDHSLSYLNSGGNVLQYQDVGNAYPRLILTSVQNTNPNVFRVFHCGVAAQSWFYEINTDTNTSTVINGPTDSQTPPASGGEPAGRLQAIYVRLHDGRVIAAGGMSIDEEESNITNSASIVDPQAASPSWSAVANMTYPRMYFLATLLADGKVMVYGPDEDGEIYDPVANSWTLINNMTIFRGYHTSGILMPDGKVIVSGGQNNGGSGGFGETDQIQIFTPPYLSAGARPAITSAPTSASYGQNISINYTSSSPITEVVLRRPGSATHSFTYNMIGHPIWTGSDNDGTVDVTIPSNPNLIPPGYYMLYIYRNGGGEKIPAVASWIKIDGSGPPADTNPPSQPSISSIVADSDTQLTVNSTISTDAEGSNPVEYQFNETTGNSGATDSGWQTGVSYIDGGLTASTQYCYQVRSRDSQGNTNNYSSTSCQTTQAGPDSDPPSPIGFASIPAAIGDAVITMTASTASDQTPPVEYQFDETSGNSGGTDSGWSQNTLYVDVELSAGTQYCYRVRARDSMGTPNVSSYSATSCTTTAAEDGFIDITAGPGTDFFPANVTINVGDTVQWTFIEEGHNVWAGLSGNHNYLLGQAQIDANTIFKSTVDKNATNPTGVTFNVTFDQNFLDIAAGDGGGSNVYNYHCHVHGSGSPEFMFGAITVNGGTDTAAPIPNPMTFATVPNAISSTEIAMVATTALDAQSAPVQYFFDEQTGNAGGSDSVWQSSTSYTDSGLSPLTSYSYMVSSRDALGNTTAASAAENATTPDAPSSNILLETGVVSGVGTSWTTVNLGSSYSSMVVVATPGYSNSSAPAHVRIQNATGNSFQVRVDGSPNAPASMDVYYMVVEEGVYMVATDGVKMEAVKYNSTVTSNNNSWVGEARSYSNSYTSPVVLGQVMTYNDAGHVTFWSRGSSRQNPPSSSVLQVGKTVNEDPDNSHANETIGYIVLESGNGAIDGVNYAAGVTSDGVAGITNSPPYGRTVSGLSSAASIGIATLTAMDGGNGGWALFYGANPISNTNINLAIDEDQLNDTERAHTGEQVAYVVFEDSVSGDTTPPTPNPATFASAPAATSSSAIAMTATTASDPSGPVEYNFDNTSGGAGGSDSEWQTSTSYTDNGLSASTQYCYTVQSRDSVGNSGVASSAACATTQAGADTTPPTPNPATFASAPAATSSTAIAMTATTGSDPSGPVEYFFTETSGNPGGSNSSWQTSTSYTDTSLTPSTQYCYTVTSRDSLGNTGASSSGSCATTQAPPDTTPPTPNPATFASAPSADSDTAISMTATTASDPSGPVEYNFDHVSGTPGGTDSGWQTSTSYTDSGLTASTQYCYTVQSRDSVGNTGTASTQACATTQAGSGCGFSWAAQVNNTDSGISYSGMTNVSAPGGFQNDAHFSAGSATASFNIDGNGLRIYVWREEYAQSFSISIDGGSAQTVNVTSGSQDSFMAFEDTTLSCGTHSVVLNWASGELHFDAYQVRN